MNFNKHSDLEGRHAFLSASKYHLINYDEEKLEKAYSKYMATLIGTRLHAFACECINLGVKLPKNKKTLNLYVNDAIGYKMETEQTLYYSDNCFGTADAICFRDNFLRIHDFKSGETPASMNQLKIYAALFCLEYDINPFDIQMELRLYQTNNIIIHKPDPKEIDYIIEKIIRFDKKIEEIKAGD